MSQSWTDGYVAEITYTYGFYRELTPRMLQVATLARGIEAPDATSSLTYCELGCGQGFSTNLLAAANPQIQFYATDFNPTQINGARKLAAAAGTANVHFFDDSFEQFIHRKDLPDFDIISLHGIYSWISAENRSHIVEFIRRRLKAGGLVYISYNTLPGWASFMPVRRLFVEHAAGSTGPILSRVDSALTFVDELLKVKGRYTGSVPGLTERLDRIKGQPKAYLAHEYFNKDWTPFYFSDVTGELGAAKVNWAASANLLDTQDAINFTSDQQKLLSTLSDPVRRESMRDYIVNQQFRRDIFVKGPLALGAQQQLQIWRKMRVALSTRAEDVPLVLSINGNDLKLQEDIYKPVLDAIGGGPISADELLKLPTVSSLGVSRLLQVLIILTGAGHLQFCLPAETDDERRDSVMRFNRAVAEQAQYSSDLGYMASPITGGGVSADRMAQLFLLAHWTGAADPVAFVWEKFAATNQRLLKDGKALDTADANIAELAVRYEAFATKNLPTYRKLGVV